MPTKRLRKWLEVISSTEPIEQVWREMYDAYGYESMRVVLFSRSAAEVAFSAGENAGNRKSISSLLYPRRGVVGHALETGEIQEASDYPNDARALPEDKNEVKSLLVIPLVSKGKDYGLIEFANHGEHHLPLPAGRMFELYVMQKHLSLWAELQHTNAKLQRQQGLTSFMGQVHEISSLDELVPYLFRNLSKDIRYDTILLSLQEGGRLRVLFGEGDDNILMKAQGQRVVPVGEAKLTNFIMQKNEPLLIGDLSDPMLRNIYPINFFESRPEDPDPQDRTRSLLAVPFETGSSRGVLSLQSTEAWRYGLADLEYLVSITDVLSYAIEQLRWRSLDEFSRALSQLSWEVGDEGQQYRRLLSLLRGVWRSRGSVLYLADPTRDEYKKRAATGLLKRSPASLNMGGISLRGPRACFAKAATPRTLTPLWLDDESKGAMLIPFGNGFIWLIGENEYTDWDLQMAHSLMRVLAPYADRLGEQRRLQKEAALDPLTGVSNRRRLKEQLRHLIALSQRNDYGFSVAYADLKNFGRVNNRYGHNVGDRVLLHTARLLAGSLREEDEIFRFGGDEFVLLFPHTSRQDALEALRRIAHVIENDAELAHYGVSINFGLAEYQPGESADELVDRADQQMYLAKKQGKIYLS